MVGAEFRGRVHEGSFRVPTRPWRLLAAIVTERWARPSPVFEIGSASRASFSSNSEETNFLVG